MTGFHQSVVLPETEETMGTGWLSPMPDLRDFSSKSPEIVEMAADLKIKNGMKVPPLIDLRSEFTPIENQLTLGSCTAHAAVGVVEYMQKKAFGKFIDGSRLFVYKTTRNLMGVTGDTGAWIRNTIGSLAFFGLPPEKYYKYVIADFDKEPSAFLYSMADNFSALKYFCYDPLGQNDPKDTVLKNIKSFLAAGIPCMFGFYGFPSFDQTDVPGGIPFPCPNEKAQWGHAIAAVGYDDNKKIKNTSCNKTTTGALIIRNSWGTKWGEKGYGYIPYEYVKAGLAIDFWSMLSVGWIDTEQFGL
jgi:C1A family cysteine protease